MTYSLLRCYPTVNLGGYAGSGNECIAECKANSFGDAVKILQASCPVPLVDGYAKQDINTFVIAEAINEYCS